MISSSLRRRDSLLFVYGTLRPFVEMPMARWLAGQNRNQARIASGDYRAHCRAR